MNAPARRLNFRQALRAAALEQIIDDSEITRSYAQALATKLTFPKQMVLVEHAAGERPYIATQDNRTVTSLIGSGLVRFRSPVDRSNTIATEKGRVVIAYLLGRWADVLAQIQGED